jgi:cysteine-rich repeat protein
MRIWFILVLVVSACGYPRLDKLLGDPDGVDASSQGGPVCGDGPLLTCGNGNMDPCEVCDDGNTVDGDGCSHDCLSLEKCGNGILDLNAATPEVCDDGNTVDGDGCSHDCLSLEKCGNGITDINEECDDGNTLPGDGCSPSCKVERCGNGIVDPGEACDLLPVDTSRCSADCKATRMCGNGIVDPGEECDLGPENNDYSDCRTDCVFNRCGDGFRNTMGNPSHTEQCDDAPPATEFSRDTTSPQSPACNINCTTPRCGDGIVNPVYKPDGLRGEQCDPPNPGHCSSTCQVE